MKRCIHPVIILATIFFLSACKTSRTGRQVKDDGKLEMIFVQVNDVYEIAPLEEGKTGGMARVATLKKQWLDSNKNTFLVMAGDFLSPSIYNSLQYQQKRVRGKQMVEAMNAAGIDLAIFGNHEFDITEAEVEERIIESSFQWVSSNAFHKQNNTLVPFNKLEPNSSQPIPTTYTLSLTDADGTKARIGFFALTLDANKASYVGYTDPFTTADSMYKKLKDSCDAVVAITHQAVADDIKLAEQIPGLALILGGHEHNMQIKKVGNVYITKAHSNARSAYITKLLIDKRAKSTQATPLLKYITDSIPFDEGTDGVVKKWIRIADENFNTLGFDPKKVLLTVGEPLDGREDSIRSRETNLTRLVVNGMAAAAPQADVVMFNAGSVRLDDILHMPVTQYDILRTLPFGGSIREVDMKGSLLQRILNAGKSNIDNGGYLHNKGATYDAATSSWIIKQKAIDPDKIYRVGMTDFLLTGNETNLRFLTPDNPDIVSVHDAETTPSSPKSDIRLAIVRYLEKAQ